MEKAVEFLKMVRPVNSLMTGLAVLFTYFVSNNYILSPIHCLLIGFATGFLVSSASMLINDVVDLDVDRVNKPWKPLPRGVFSPLTIKYVSLLFLVASVLLNTVISLYAFLVVLILGSIAYSYSFFRHLWWSHFIVSLGTVAPFIYGYVLAGSPMDKLCFITLFSIVIFLVNSSREFVKSIADVEGDRMLGYKTIAIVFGVDKASKLALIYAILGSITAVAIGLLGYASMYYTIILGIAGTMFTIQAYRVYKSPLVGVCVSAKNRMLYSMLLALVGYLLSSL